MHKQTDAPSLREYLRGILIRYALVPASAAMVILFAAMFSLNIAFAVYQTQRNNAAAAGALEAGIAPYLEKIGQLTAGEGLRGLLEEGQSPREMYEALYRFTNSQAVGCQFYLIDAGGGVVMSSRTVLPSYLQPERPYLYGLFRRMESFPQKAILMLNDTGNLFSSNIVFSVGQAVRGDGGEILDFFVFELDKQSVYDYIYTGTASDIVVSDIHNTVLLTSRNSFLSKYSKLAGDIHGQSGIRRIQDQSCYVAVRTLEELGLRVYSIGQLEDYLGMLPRFGAVLVLLLLFLVFVMFTIADNISASETRSVDKMLEAIRRMQREDLYTDIVFEDTGPFAVLQTSYQQLLGSIRQLVEQNAEEMRRSTRAEIRQLESQFNPHFIFNTLEVIRCLIKLDPQAASQMLVDFSQLLRYSISSQQGPVPLAEDFRYLRRYLDIAQRRYENHLHYAFRVDPEAEGCQIPRLILQPVVENAVKYGIRRRPDLTVTITAGLEGGELVLSVRDDGGGIEPEKQQAIRDSFVAGTEPAEHFGLYNVHRRLQLMYGTAEPVRLQSVPGEGTTVTVTIPPGPPEEKNQKGGESP